jgi:hypothetical protein
MAIKENNFYVGSAVAMCLSILLLVSTVIASQLKFSDFSLSTPDGRILNIGQPGFIESAGSGTYEMRGNLVVGRFSSKGVRIIPDDEIVALIVNGTDVNLASIPLQARKDYRMGFPLDLSSYLVTGSNDIVLRYRDRGGLMGIVLAAEGGSTYYRIISSFIALIILAASLCFMRKLKLNRMFQIIFIGGMLIRVFYFTVTPPETRGHDLGDHIGYVEYLSENWLPPPIEHAVGGAFFHPPFYYYTGALIYKLSQVFEPDNKVTLYRVQQILCLIYSLGFMFFGLLILKAVLDWFSEDNESYLDGQLSVRATNLFWVVGLLFAFWPVSIIHSVRVGNDPLLYFLFSASLYYILLWYRSDSRFHLIAASMIGAFAILTKANGEILIAVLGVVGLYKMIRSKQWLRYFRVAIVPCLLMFGATAITIAPGLILKMEGKRDKLYIDNIDGLSKANLVGNTAANYFWFDAKTFIVEPYTDPYDDRMGRQYFWNYLAKTGLFGEFKYPSLQSKNAAVICSFLFVIMSLYVFSGIYYMRKQDFKLLAVVLLSGFFLWAGVTYMRITFPANIDFRYIVPVLITFCALHAISILGFYRIGAKRMADIGKVLAVMFSIGSVIFITGIR